MITKDEKDRFINSIKDQCISTSIYADILPSVVAAIAIGITDFGTSLNYTRTNNLFNIPADENFNGRCYSKDSRHMYEHYSENTEKNAILYRAYEKPSESLKDFITYLKTCRRSKNGPLKYNNIFRVSNYKKTIFILMESEFVYDFLHMSDNITWYSNMISIIEQNKLYEWDNEMEDFKMSRKHSKSRVNVNQAKNIFTQKYNCEKHMYRVRLEWERPDTQIFASPVYEDALKEAKSHEGYKIFIDDDGELFEDPWEKIPEHEVEKEIPGIKKINHPIKGHSIILRNTPVYKNAIDKASFKTLSGEFFYYDSTTVNGRAKITIHKNITNPDPSLILGYIKV